MWCDFWLECLEKPEYNKIPIYNSVLRCFCIPDAVFYLPCAGILQVEATPPLFAILDRVGM